MMRVTVTRSSLVKLALMMVLGGTFATISPYGFSATVVVLGTDGDDGLDGANGSPPGAGLPGGDGLSAASLLNNLDAFNDLLVGGGSGGDGGLAGRSGPNWGNGGDGGDSGNARARVIQNVPGTAIATAASGHGGRGATGAFGGDGGNAGRANAVADGIVIGGDLSVTAIARGGRGGDGGGEGFPFGAAGNAGDGGNARASASATTLDASTATAVAESVGGRGGFAGGFTIIGAGGAGGTATAEAFAESALGDAFARAMATGGEGRFGIPGGHGGDVELIDAISGAAAGVLRLEQIAFGGAGSGPGGDATSTLNLTNEFGGDIDARLEATGGESGSQSFGEGGGALVGASLTTAGDIVAILLATGGEAGSRVADPKQPPMIGYDGAAPTILNSLFESTTGGTIDVDIVAIGGEGGGFSLTGGLPAGSTQGDGASVNLTDIAEIRTSGTVRYLQLARGGEGGRLFLDGSLGGSGGSAVSAMTDVLAAELVDIQILAQGGTAGSHTSLDIPTLEVPTGGNADAVAHIENPTGSLSLFTEARGGFGGDVSTFGEIAADGGDATASAFGQTGGEDVSLNVTSSALGGAGADYRAPGEFRGGSAGVAWSEAEGIALGADTDAVISASALGGRGAGAPWLSGGRAANARDGAAASALATGTNHGEGSLTVSATATGGLGGNAGGFFDNSLVGGRGGEATAFAIAESLGGGSTIINVTQIGGEGGEGLSSADSGDGAHSVLDNAFSVVASGALQINQTAIGGDGGDFFHLLNDRSPSAGDGGDASSSVNFDYLADLVVDVAAEGGDSGSGQIFGDSSFNVIGGEGGNATTNLTVSTTGSLNATSVAEGGAAKSGDGLSAGAGGTATSFINAEATGGAPENQHVVSGTAQGGRAGSVLQPSSMAILSDGGSANSIVVAEAEKGALTVDSFAQGGIGGYWSLNVTGPAGVAGGSASSNAAGTHAGIEVLTIVSSAIGGNAGELGLDAVNIGFVGGNADSMATADADGGGTASAIAEATGGVGPTEAEHGSAVAYASSRATEASWSFAGAAAVSSSSVTASTDATSENMAGALLTQISAGATTTFSSRISTAAGFGDPAPSALPDFDASFELIANGLPTAAVLDDLLIEELGGSEGNVIVNPDTHRALSGASSVALGVVSLSAMYDDESFAQGVVELFVDSQQLDPDADFFISFLNAESELGALEHLDLLLKIDDVTHFSKSFDDYGAAASFFDDNPIELGLVGSLFDGGLASIVFEVSASTNGDPMEISFDTVIGTSAPEPITVPIPLVHIALGGFLIMLTSSRGRFVTATALREHIRHGLGRRLG